MYEFLDYRVEDVMSRPVMLQPEDAIGKAQALLEEHGFNALPVVDAERRGLTLRVEHWAQMQVYMHLSGLTRALYLAVCKDNDALHASESPGFDPDVISGLQTPL